MQSIGLSNISSQNLVSISEGRRSNLELHLADGTQRRVTLKCTITDYTVRSVLKILKRILPSHLYASLYTDVVTLLTSKTGGKVSYQPD